MGKDIHVKLDLSVPTRTLVLAMTAALLVTVTPELDSENVTLSTYYPAPSGVYSKMITTGNTFLGTGGSNVGIGTTSPSQRLDVNGNVKVGGGTYITQMGTTWGGWNESIRLEGAGHAAIAFPAGHLLFGLHSNTNFYWANTDTGRYTMTLGNTGKLAIPNYFYLDNTNTYCSPSSCAANGSPCAAGTYATWTRGLYIEGYSYENRGYPANVNVEGNNSNKVWALNTTTGKIGWGTLQTQASGTGLVWCCPK